jgi:hypothetical protein
MSGPLPQNYVVHTVIFAIVIVAAMVFLLSRNWGCSPLGA